MPRLAWHGAHIRAKSQLLDFGRLIPVERRTLRWTKPDSNSRSRRRPPVSLAGFGSRSRPTISRYREIRQSDFRGLEDLGRVTRDGEGDTSAATAAVAQRALELAKPAAP
jgi:hypothetical protein